MVTYRVLSLQNQRTVTSRVFVDDYSGALGVYFLKNKSDAVRATEQSDDGGEYISEEFKSLLLKNHIKRQSP